MTEQDIETMTEEEFEDLVSSEAYGQVAEDVGDLLAAPGVLQRWYATLIKLKSQMESQIADINAQVRSKKQEYLRRGPKFKDEWFQLEANLQERRASHNRLKTRIEDRIREAKGLMGDAGVEPDHLKNRIKFLEGEVERLTLVNADLKKQLRDAGLL